MVTTPSKGNASSDAPKESFGKPGDAGKVDQGDSQDEVVRMELPGPDAELSHDDPEGDSQDEPYVHKPEVLFPRNSK